MTRPEKETDCWPACFWAVRVLNLTKRVQGRFLRVPRFGFRQRALPSRTALRPGSLRWISILTLAGSESLKVNFVPRSRFLRVPRFRLPVGAKARFVALKDRTFGAGLEGVAGVGGEGLGDGWVGSDGQAALWPVTS